MKGLVLVFCLAVSMVVTTGVFAQTTRSFGSVVFPGGTSATSPGTTRNFGSAVFPGGAAVPPVRGGSPVIGTPVVGIRPGVGFTNPGLTQPRGGQNFHGTPAGRNQHNQTYVYAYPVYVGGSYDNGYNTNYAPQEAPPQQPQQNVTIVYPPQHATPVMIQAGPQGEYSTTGGARQGYESPGAAPLDLDAPDTNRFLIAFKDHTIYSAVAYWADGDTLHYFTTGNTHNQVSVSLIDRGLTERLNKELGIDFKLPPAK